MTKRFREILLLSMTILMAGRGSSAYASDPVRLETFKTHSRLSIRLDGLEGAAPEFKSDGQGFEFFFKGLGLSDLGAPLGEEVSWARRFKELRDPRVADFAFEEVPGGLKIRGRWKFPEGRAALANPAMEAFDYRDKTRAAVVLDFWVKEGPTVAEVRTQNVVARNIASIRKRDEDERIRATRRAAREKAQTEAEDPMLFCRAPLSEDGDVFLQFYPFHENLNFAQWIPQPAPDSNYEYNEPKAYDDDLDPEEGKGHSGHKDRQYVRLALRLYKQGNFALTIRTLDFLAKEHPKSVFRAEMRFLRANALFKLGLIDPAMKQLKESLYDPKAGASSLQAALFIVGRHLEAGNHLAALETFMWLASHHGKNEMAWVFHMGAAESARALKQTDRAVREYEWVATHAPERASRAEGALRTGDLYMERFQYDQALAAYAQGLRRFGEESAHFPAVYINRAEALYGLGQLDRAREAFSAFLNRFPAHPQGWRAAYRLGEIEARKTGSARESLQARHWYLETINRFPLSPGATLARLQLAPCGDHAGLTVESAQRLYQTEAEAFDGGGQVTMDRYKDFRALSRVRTLMTLGQEKEAVATAIEELRRVTRIEARRWLGNLLSMNFRKTVIAFLNEDKKLEALTFYQQNEGVVPRGASADARIDVEYLLKLSRAASDLGLGKLAHEISQDYEKSRKAMKGPTPPSRALASNGSHGSKAGREKPVSDDPEVRMQVSERNFTEAKALWISSGIEAESRIRAALASVDAESRFSGERELILGLMDEKRGKHQSALRHASRAQVLSKRDARIDAWVAALEAKAGDSRAALAAYRTLEAQAFGTVPVQGPQTASELLGVPAIPAREALILAESEILESLGRWGEAAANYTRAVESGLGGSQAVYGYAHALLKAGGQENRSKALTVLEALVGPDSAVGKKPAKASPVETDREPAASTKRDDASVEVERARERENEKDKFWKRLASETLANEKLGKNAKEGIRQ